jgi:phage terminase large subunit GpA-like protein
MSDLATLNVTWYMGLLHITETHWVHRWTMGMPIFSVNLQKGTVTRVGLSIVKSKLRCLGFSRVFLGKKNELRYLVLATNMLTYIYLFFV